MHTLHSPLWLKSIRMSSTEVMPWPYSAPLSQQKESVQLEVASLHLALLRLVFGR
jgi:hypothetical protein